MIRINKKEKDYLIENGFLAIKRGKYEDLHITSKRKKGKGKTYYVPDYYKKHLRKA